MCGAIATTSPKADQKERSCCSTTNEASTGTFISLMGTKAEEVPAGGTGCTVKCCQVKGVDRKSCCASLLVKQTSRSEMSAMGTIPTADVGMEVVMFIAQ